MDRTTDREGTLDLPWGAGSKREVNGVVNSGVAMGKGRRDSPPPPPPGNRIILGANPWRDTTSESLLYQVTGNHLNKVFLPKSMEKPCIHATTSRGVLYTWMSQQGED